jgi:DMSO/TMAO reductase YedYZ heme-binding membrane subunit
MSTSAETPTQSSNEPLGAGRGLRRRLILHHVPLAIASVVVLVLFMSLPFFDVNMHSRADVASGAFPRRGGEDQAAPTGHGGGHAGLMHHGDHHAGPMGHGGDHHSSRGASVQRLVVATGYIALGLLVLTLVIGPANLIFHRRIPVSNYLSRDVGTWAVIFSVVHTIVLLLAHDNGGGLVASSLQFFVAPDGSLLTNSFGLGNWTGLVALLIAVGLLAISNDFALRKLKAGPWKRLQRLNYVLFALVPLHAFFYGALLRVTSPFTVLLGLSVLAVFVGQAVGIRLWRRRYGHPAATITRMAASSGE